jgi:hypothetical protein
MADIKVRVGQQNAIKVLSGISGAAGGISVVSANVIGGIASVTSLNVSSSSYFIGFATFYDNVYFNSDIYVDRDVYISGAGTLYVGIASIGKLFYGSYYSGGIAYFDDTGALVSTGSTSSSIDYTNYILTVDSIGAPTWSSVIDGGQY